MTSANPQRRVAHNAAYYGRGGKEKVVAAKKAAITRNKDYIKHLKDSPCADCGVRYPYYVMDFDHVNGEKDRDISRLANAPVSLPRLIAELDKCELVCSNCHRERTHVRSSLISSAV
jgi:hypothetical protein